MKRKIIFFLSMLLGYCGMAQITITNAYFPSIGDTLRTATATPALTRGTRITPAGQRQMWDYSYLRSAMGSRSHTSEVYSAPPTNDTTLQRLFAGVDLVVAFDTNAYNCYNKTITRFELMGFKGFNPLAQSSRLRVSPVFQPFVLERRAPLAYNTFNANQSNFNIVIAADLLPDTLWSTLPVRPDSIRVRFNTSRKDTVDAWGSIAIPGASYPALREKRVEITEQKIEVKVNPLPIWLDVTNLFPVGGTAGRDTTTTYYFWSSQAKEPILVLTAAKTRPDSVTRAEYKYLIINTNTDEKWAATEGGALHVYPNPATNILQLDAQNLPAGRYAAKIFDQQGRLHQSQILELNNNQVSLPIGYLAQGIYILQLVDSQSNKIVGNTKFLKQ